MHDDDEQCVSNIISTLPSMQKKAWNILTDSPPVSRTSAICHALCEYRQQWAFLRAIQQLLDDTLSHIVHTHPVL